MRAEIRLHQVFSALAIFLSVFMVFVVSEADTQKPVVFVAPIEGVIDLGLAPFVQRVLDEATAAGAKAVILNINTFGGRVDAAVLIRDALLNSKVLTVAFINKRAISAGALISLASEKIAMADGGTIGAATPVQIGLPGSPAQPVEEKTVSYMRKEFRATAEQRNRPPLIAEAMVDADVEVPDLVEKSKLLTLTTKEALQADIADFQANSLEAVLQSVNLADAEIRYVSETWAESLVRFLTHPVVSSLLMTVGILGIMLEMRMPGFGVPGALGLISLALFFWGHGLVQLAGLEEFLLVGLGLILVGLEIFVIPGFGIAGILGIMALMGGLGLSLIGTGATWDFMLSALGQVALSILVAIIAVLIVLRYFPRLPFGRRLILETNLQAQEGYESSPPEDHRWLGKQGIAVSDLHPSGIARFDRERVDVVSDGTFIDAGQPLEVVRIDGNRVVVRLAPPHSEKETV
ncbi:MAG: nodulation protein NfeD [Nitrospirales bacterium]|nr:nodulation protein NfeD [Nitrospirales bacterium]